MPEFKIHHITRYSYENPVRDSANQIILFPIKDEYQEVIKHELKISGDPSVDIHTDYYGNDVGSFTHIEPHTQLEISSKIWVNTRHRLYPVDDMFPAQQWADLINLRNQVAFIDFLRSENFDGLAEMMAVIEAEKIPDETPYQAAVRYCRYVYENFVYIKGVTTVETTLDEIWQLKAGVCQDFAHILMEMLRVVNIPARYVSGYICTSKTSSLRGEGATHAWVEAYIPEYGWLGLDPTNNIIANENHIRLAVGRNFMDCSPVKGVYKGAGQHVLEVAVSVGNSEDEEHTEYENHQHDIAVAKPIKPVAKNSYREYLEFIQQQQQQQ